MKITKLNRRYNANKKWGYEWQVQIPSIHWRKYFAIKSQAQNMFGPSEDTVRHYMWRERMQILQSAAWAFHYDKSSKPSYVYFRTEDHMTQCLMMFALTNT